MKLRVGHLYPEYLNIYADRGNIAVLSGRAELRGHTLEIAALGVGDEISPDAYDLYYVGGGQDREQAAIAPDLAAKGPAIGGGGGQRRRAARGVRRLPAPRTRLPGARRVVHARRRPLPARDRGWHDADDRRRAARVRARSRAAADGRRVREPRRTHAARRGRGAARPRAPRLRERRRVGLRGLPRASARSGRTCTARCFPGTHGSRTGFSRRRSPTPRTGSLRSSTSSRTSSPPRRTAVAAQRAKARGGRR